MHTLNASTPSDSTIKDPSEPLSDRLLSLLSSPNHANATLEKLALELDCSPDDIAAALEISDIHQNLALRTQLAFLQVKFLALQYLPHAMAKTVTLMNEAEKPEVARRSASCLMQIVGLPTRTSPQPAFATPAPAQNASEEDAPDSDADGFLAAAAFVKGVQRHGVDLTSLPSELHLEFIDYVRDFMHNHNIPYSWGYGAPPNNDPSPPPSPPTPSDPLTQ